MPTLKSLSRPFAFLVGLMLAGSELAIAPTLSHAHVPPSSQTKQLFGRPRQGGLTSAAGRSRSGAHRGACATVQGTGLSALMPAPNVGQTTENHPTFWLYMPYTRTTNVAGAKFMLLNADLDPVLSEPLSVPLPETPGIISFRLPDSVPPLEVGQSYNWYFWIVCDPQKPSRNPVVSGWIERVAVDATLTNELRVSDLHQQYTVYARNGIWFDTLTQLADQRCRDRQNRQLLSDWQTLFQDAEITSLADEPLLCDRTAR